MNCTALLFLFVTLDGSTLLGHVRLSRLAEDLAVFCLVSEGWEEVITWTAEGFFLLALRSCLNVILTLQESLTVDAVTSPSDTWILSLPLALQLGELGGLVEPRFSAPNMAVRVISLVSERQNMSLGTCEIHNYREDKGEGHPQLGCW